MGRGPATDTLLSDPASNMSYIPYAGGYHQRQGYATSSPTDSPRASKMYRPSSRWTWSFLAITALQAVIGLALEGYVFAVFQIQLNPKGRDNPQSRTVPAYLSLFIFGFIYQLVLVWDALRLKNTIQIIGLCLYNIGLLVEAAVQSDQIEDAVNNLVKMANGPGIDENFWSGIHPFIIAVPCVIALATVLMSLVAWKLYDEFAWSIYKHISADLKLRSMYLSYQVYIALLKFDFFFFLAFTVQFLVVVVNTSDFEFYITIVAVPVTIVLLFLAGYWTRKENTAGMIGTIVRHTSSPLFNIWLRWDVITLDFGYGTHTLQIIYFAGLAYFLFKLVRMYDGPSNRVNEYVPARKSLTTFAVITVLLLIVTIVYACICTYNFGRGLKPHISSRRSHIGRRTESEEMAHLYANNTETLNGQRQDRMTID